MKQELSRHNKLLILRLLENHMMNGECVRNSGID